MWISIELIFLFSILFCFIRFLGNFFFIHPSVYLSKHTEISLMINENYKEETNNKELHSLSDSNDSWTHSNSIFLLLCAWFSFYLSRLTKHLTTLSHKPCKWCKCIQFVPFIQYIREPLSSEFNSFKLLT